MHGIQVQTRAEPLTNEWSVDERSTAIKVVGGIGDALILTRVALSAKANKAIYVRAHQVDLIKYLVGADVFVGKAADLNSTAVRGQYGGVFNCDPVFVAGHREIRNKDYYQLAGDFLGILSAPLKKFPEGEPKQKWVAIHAGASNPNRRIDVCVWLKLAAYYVQEGYKIKWLGTFGDFGYCNKDNECLWEESSCLVEQTKILQQCALYFGNDSGFAHIAGMLGVPGHVFFTNTVPEHVIGRYPTLTAVDCFKDIGQVPSRGLKINDPCASACIKHLTPGRVFKTLGMDLPPAHVAQQGKAPQRVVSYSGDLDKFRTIVTALEKAGYFFRYNGSHLPVKVLVTFGDENSIQIEVDGIPHHISGELHPEAVIRAFREILN